MNRFWSFLIALAAIAATVMILTVKAPHAGTSAPGPKIGLPQPPPPPAPVALEQAIPPPPPPWFELKRGEGLSLLLTGLVPTEEAKSAILASASLSSPELIAVREQIEVNPDIAIPPWLVALPDLIAHLVAGVQEPELRIDPDRVRIGGVSGNANTLAAIRTRFEATFTIHTQREDGLRHDETRPPPETRMPLVLYFRGKLFLRRFTAHRRSAQGCRRGRHRRSGERAVLRSPSRLPAHPRRILAHRAPRNRQDPPR